MNRARVALLLLAAGCYVTGCSVSGPRVHGPGIHGPSVGIGVGRHGIRPHVSGPGVYGPSVTLGGVSLRSPRGDRPSAVRWHCPVHHGNCVSSGHDLFGPERSHEPPL